MVIVNKAKFPRTFLHQGAQIVLKHGVNRITREAYESFMQDKVCQKLVGLQTGLDVPEDQLQFDVEQTKKNPAYINELPIEDAVDVAKAVPQELVPTLLEIVQSGGARTVLKSRMPQE